MPIQHAEERRVTQLKSYTKNAVAGDAPELDPTTLEPDGCFEPPPDPTGLRYRFGKISVIASVARRGMTYSFDRPPFNDPEAPGYIEPHMGLLRVYGDGQAVRIPRDHPIWPKRDLPKPKRKPRATEPIAPPANALLTPAKAAPTKYTAHQINKLIECIRSGQQPDLPEGICEKHYHDPALPGVYIRLLRTGVATWNVQWKRLGRQKKIALGNVRVLDRQEAIEAAKELLAKVTLDTLDPHKARRERMRADKVTFAVVAALFLKRGKGRKGDLRPNTVEQWTRYLNGYYFEPLHSLPIDEIAREQIQTRIDHITIQSGKRAAHHCCVVMRVLFKWALKTGKLPDGHPNPMTNVEPPKQNGPRERVLTDDEIRLIWKTCEAWEADAIRYEEIKASSDDRFWQRREKNTPGKDFQIDAWRPRELAASSSALSRKLLGDKLDKLEAEIRNNPAGNTTIARKVGVDKATVRRARARLDLAAPNWIGSPPITDFPRGIMLLFLTGCRAQEIGDLQWSEVDLDNGELRIPGTRTKNHENLCNPLSDWAVQILRRIKRQPGRDGIFAHPNLRKSNRHIKKRVTKAGGIPPWTIHDIRRTFRTRMAALGVRMEVAEVLVGHVGHRPAMERVYNKYEYWPEKRQALAMWETNLRAIIDGTAEKIAHPRFGKKGGAA